MAMIPNARITGLVSGNWAPDPRQLEEVIATTSRAEQLRQLVIAIVTQPRP